ncbi:ArnT family glycosyltransferase [Rhodospirillum rubrum]|uniref:Glycosyltransferase RgtA/B/C/D-like domain-containing protein n=1 Tax=Rhodospirillum rubrum (strain ATCC 11170 / ATH 1.1.1 / DSM 467 / LMG 4362 / NCIMB 8255 / S1) TaxID=269796 RepID=Q2RPS0_RHORT|nr:glycosyltransferase family 39 protein [Rhodospirillum rubrum]ABC23875.1 hypothetical protein Rru_A3080 [Rhodospirillum rubrum ATCC 11170]AEO49618.1 hypothetical protein F11_15780 [Rhodospirillum rubrum F11]MBK5955551.1 hypothetical protein [Rhodospirillum rubrum]QXG79821.1 glycosyltransferase family 39 protein [Rhodospirillum rubrum]HAQ00828.1 hypothetical protein [Rhodospirillum rubrum]
MHRLITRWHPFALLTLLSLALLLPAVLGAPLGFDEARFLDDTRTLAGGGSEPIATPGAHWLGLLVLWAGGEGAPLWGTRLPDLLCAVLGVLVVHDIGRTVFNKKIALVAGALFAASLALDGIGTRAGAGAPGALAGLALMDLLMRLHLQAKGGAPMALWMAHGFWFVLGAALLTQGLAWPLLAVAFLALISAERRSLGWLVPLRPFPGVIFLAAVIGPWLAALPEGTLGTALWPPMAGEPALVAPTALLVLWPTALFAAPALGRLWNERADPANSGLAAWLIGAIGLIALHDTAALAALPGLAPLALATAAALFAVRDGTYGLFRQPPALGVYALWGVATGWLIVEAGDRAAWTTEACLAAAATTLAGLYTLILIGRGRYLNAAAAALLTALLLRLAP